MENGSKRHRSSILYDRILLVLLLPLLLLVGGAFLLSHWFGPKPPTGEPPVLQDAQIADPAPAQQAVRPESTVPQPEAFSQPESASQPEAPAPQPQGDLAGGVIWPTLPQERRDGLSNETVGWGQGVQVNEKNQPLGALDGQAKYGDLGGYFIFPDADNTVYLTFDLGYENGYTDDILDALKEKGVHGVFFVTMDYVTSAPELVQRIIDEGHVLGNHSVHHPSMPSCSTDDAKQEILGLHEYVKEHFGGYEMSLFRFPRGEFSEKTLVLARDLGYASVFWSYAYVDWKTDSQPDVAASLEKLTKAAHPGAIYLLHTVSATNAALMGDLVDNLTAAGYTIGELPH